jgi:hypothetical protein
MTPVRTRVIHGGEDEQASIERKGSRDDFLGTAVIHGDEDEKGVDPEKGEPNKKNLQQKLKSTPYNKLNIEHSNVKQKPELN